MNAQHACRQHSKHVSEACWVQALGPEAGQAFLDIGSGTGYLTMVAANLVGHTGKAVGLEVTLYGTAIPFL